MREARPTNCGREATPWVTSHVVRNSGGWWDDYLLRKRVWPATSAFPAHPEMGTRRRGLPYQFSGARATCGRWVLFAPANEIDSPKFPRKFG